MSSNPNPLPSLPRPTKTYHTQAYDRISPSQASLSLKGKTLFITGGAGGVGRALCNGFAEAGVSRIFIVARSIGPLAEVKDSLESRHKDLAVTTYATSVTDSARLAEIVKEVGRIDVFVSAAAYVHDAGPTSQLSVDQIAECFRVNAVAPFAIISAILRERDDNDDLKIIYISSALSHTHIPILSGYAASKAAFNHLIEHFAAEWAGRGVCAFNLHPGLFYTEMTKRSRRPDEMPWEDVNLPAGFSVWLCSPEAKFLSGKMLWAQWDVDELLAKKEGIQKDPSRLEIGLNV